MTPVEQWTDAAIDALLGEVPLPEGIGGRLRPAAVFDDPAIDRIIAEVAVPVGVASRIRRAVFPAVERTPRPDAAETFRAGRGVRWLRALVHDGLAVALAIGFVALTFGVGLRLADSVRPPDSPRARDGARGPLRAAPARPTSGVPVVGQIATIPGPRERVVPEAADARPGVGTGGETDGAGQEPESEGRVRPPVVRAAPVPLSQAPGRHETGIFTGMRVISEGSLPDGASALRSVPAIRGFDLAFEMAHGEPPFVDPANAQSLAIDRPPLVAATDSFDRLWPLSSGRQRLAEAERLRVEHVLAALSAPPGRGTGPLMTLSAVRSLRPGRPTYLVEARVAVPSADIDAASGTPVESTLVLDHSAGPEALTLWVAACRGLAVAAARMGTADRLTIVVAEARPRVVALRAPAAEIARLADELAAELPFGIADLDAAVTLAMSVAQRERTGPAIVVFAHVDHAERCVGPGREALHAWRGQVARGESLTASPRFLLVSGVPDGSSTAAASLPGWTISDPTLLRRQLPGLLVDRPVAMARDVGLEVRFDPGTVAAYRLVGHRQSVPESLAAFGTRPLIDGSVEVHAGETVRAVYEVVPRREARQRLAGITAVLSYRDPLGAARTVTADGVAIDAGVGGLPTSPGCELLLAVGVGEFAGRSIHALPRRTALDGMHAVASAWERRGDVTVAGRRLIDVLENLGTGGGPAVTH